MPIFATELLLLGYKSVQTVSLSIRAYVLVDTELNPQS